MAKGTKTGGGSRKGVPNKVTAEFRDTVRKLLEDNAGNVGRWLTLVAEGDGTDNGKPDPAKALDLLSKLAEFAAPKLNRTEHAGDPNAPLKTSLDVRFVD
jgi:hypothetical protein